MTRIFCLAIGYVFGLFQTSYIIGKLHGIDIRDCGSGNAGTTNMLRTLGTKWGVATFAGDFLKSFLAVMLVSAIFSARGSAIVPLLKFYAGAGAVLGHDFPFYLNFRGGKGVASTAGMIAACDPLLFLILLAIFSAVYFPTRYISLSSLAAYAAFLVGTVFSGLLGRFHMTHGRLVELDVLTLLLMALCYYRHRTNIMRLCKGTENKTFLFRGGH